MPTSGTIRDAPRTTSSETGASRRQGRGGDLGPCPDDGRQGDRPRYGAPCPGMRRGVSYRTRPSGDRTRAASDLDQRPDPPGDRDRDPARGRLWDDRCPHPDLTSNREEDPWPRPAARRPRGRRSADRTRDGDGRDDRRSSATSRRPGLRGPRSRPASPRPRSCSRRLTRPASRWPARTSSAKAGTPPSSGSTSRSTSPPTSSRPAGRSISAAITVRGRVPGATEASFREAAETGQGRLPDLAGAQGQRRALASTRRSRAEPERAAAAGGSADRQQPPRVVDGDRPDLVVRHAGARGAAAGTSSAR